jgi:hypothetical protein
MDGQGGCHLLEGKGALALGEVDQHAAREGAEVPRFELQHLVDVGERAFEVVDEVAHGRALVPALSVGRIVLDQLIE